MLLYSAKQEQTQGKTGMRVLLLLMMMVLLLNNARRVAYVVTVAHK